MGAAEDAGSIESELRLNLTQMEKDALEAQRKMDELAAKLKEKGKDAGDGFSKGFNSGKTKYDASLNTMKANLAALGPWGVSVGNKLANGLSRPVIAAVPKMAMAFRSLQAAMGPIMIVIGLVTSAVMAIKGFVDKQNQAAKEAKEKQEAFNKTVKETESLYANLSSSVGGMSRDVNLQVKLIGSGSAALERQTESQARFNSLLGGAVESLRQIDIIRTGNANVSREEAMYTQRMEVLYRNQLDLLRDQFDTENDIAARKEFNLLQEQKAVELEEAKNKSAWARYDVLQKLWLDAQSIEGADIRALEQEANHLLIMANVSDENLKKAKEKLAVLQQEDVIGTEILAAQEKYNEALRLTEEIKAASIAAGLDADEAEKKAADERFKASQNLSSALTQIKDKYDAQSPHLDNLIKLEQDRVAAVEQTRREEERVAKAKENQKKIGDLMMDQSDTLLQQEIEALKAKASAAKTETERNAALDEAVKLEKDLIERQRLRAWEAIQQSEEYIAASDHERDEILRNFDMITEGMKQAREKAKNEGGFLESIFQSEGYATMLQVGGAAIDAFDSISNAALEISRRHAEEQIAIIESGLTSMLEQIEASRKAELEEKLFARATSEEEIQKQIDRAKEAGDEVLQYKLERRKEELEINKRYDDKEKEEKDKAAREIAEIEYKLAKQEHALQIVQAVNAGAMAVLQALKSAMPPINFVLAGLAGTAAAVQIGLLAANPPKPPQFASGGIVPGRRSDGDVQHVIATAGEVILNEAQQKNLAGKLGNREYTQLTVIVQVDSREMAQAMADVYGSGKVLIPVRGIAR